jgi:hypothetical protein
MVETLIHIQWSGPYPLARIGEFTGASDYGIYQVCGKHPVYGSSALLYLGKAQEQTFGVRLQQEGWHGWQETNGNIEIYLGHLSCSTTPDNTAWSEEIARAERLLIYAHRPAHNASGLYRNSDPEVGSLHILNWGERGCLLPEVSGARWSERFAVIEGYGPYGSHAAG